jgi:hypothetical protein
VNERLVRIADQGAEHSNPSNNDNETRVDLGAEVGTVAIISDIAKLMILKDHQTDGFLELTGSRYESLRENIRIQGCINDAAVVDVKGTTWHGRARRRIAIELGLPLPVRWVSVEDGPREAAHGAVTGRKASIREQAGFVYWANEEGMAGNPLSPEEIKEAEKTLRKDRKDNPDLRLTKHRTLLSVWLKVKAGWPYPSSPAMNERYIKVHEKARGAPDDVLERLSKVQTISAAYNLLHPKPKAEAKSAKAPENKVGKDGKVVDRKARTSEFIVWVNSLPRADQEEVRKMIAEQKWISPKKIKGSKVAQ